MTPNAARRIFWALQQEALCHDHAIGLNADGLRTIRHLPHHFQLLREPALPDIQLRFASLRN